MSCDAAGRETRASRMRGCGPEGQLKGDACRAACVSRVERGGLALRAAHVTIAQNPQELCALLRVCETGGARRVCGLRIPLALRAA